MSSSRPIRAAGAPADDFLAAGNHCVGKLLDERRRDVRAVLAEGVMLAVQVDDDRHLPLHAALLLVGAEADLLELLAEAVGLDGRVQRSGPEVGLLHFADEGAGVGACRADGHELLDADLRRGIDEMGGHDRVAVEDLRWLRDADAEAAVVGRRVDNELRLERLQGAIHASAVHEVEVGPARRRHAEAALAQSHGNAAPEEAGATGEEYGLCGHLFLPQ
jgi:hypothetical protein